MASGRAKRPVLRVVLLALGLVGAALIVRQFGGSAGTEWVDDFVRDKGLPGEAIFLAVGMAATAAGIPRQVIAFLAGYAFGAGLGTGLALVAQLGGGVLAFLWAREIGQDWAQARLRGRYGERLRTLRDALAGNPFSSILALRLLPIGNNLALNLLSGVAGVRLVPYLLASALGYLPQTVIFVLLGEGIAVEETTRLGLAVALFVVSALIGFALLRRHRAAQVLEQAEAAEAAEALAEGTEDHDPAPAGDADGRHAGS